jgi:four helix bundle protein
MRDFRKLQVWEKSHALVLGIYQTTRSFPKDELYGLTSQMRRASASIPANTPKAPVVRASSNEFISFK